MPDSQNNVEQTLRDLNSKLEQQVASLQSEITNLKNKDSEVAIATLRKDVTDRDAVIVERDKTISGLQAQISTITESSKSLEQKLQTAESALATANETLTSLKADEAKRVREAMLREKNAPEDVIAGLVDRLSVLDDTAFAATIDTISGSWKKPAKVADPVVESLKKAKAEEDPALTTSSDDDREKSFANLVNFMGKSMKSARAGRPSIYENTNADA